MQAKIAATSVRSAPTRDVDSPKPPERAMKADPEKATTMPTPDNQPGLFFQKKNSARTVQIGVVVTKTTHCGNGIMDMAWNHKTKWKARSTPEMMASVKDFDSAENGLASVLKYFAQSRVQGLPIGKMMTVAVKSLQNAIVNGIPSAPLPCAIFINGAARQIPAIPAASRRR